MNHSKFLKTLSTPHRKSENQDSIHHPEANTIDQAMLAANQNTFAVGDAIINSKEEITQAMHNKVIGTLDNK